jgi:ankyrin repeat protein
LNLKTEKNITPLHQVAYNNDEAMLDYLIFKGIKMEGPWSEFGSPFMWACAEGHLKMMERISEMKDFSGVEDQDKNGGTALHISCATGNSKVVDWLIKKVRLLHQF